MFVMFNKQCSILILRHSLPTFFVSLSLKHEVSGVLFCSLENGDLELTCTCFLYNHHRDFYDLTLNGATVAPSLKTRHFLIINRNNVTKFE